MKLFLHGAPIALMLSTVAFGQAGAEGEYDLVVSSATPSSLIPSAAIARTNASTTAAIPVRTSSAPSTTTTLGTSVKKPAAKRAMIDDYDFGEVVETIQHSVQPLAGELDGGFKRFVGQIDDAVILMENGRKQEAVALSAGAIEGVLASRDSIIDPLWEAQFYLNTQIANVRARLAKSLTADSPDTSAGKAKASSSQMLDQIAQRISTTKDPVAKKRLVAHYRTLRTLAKVSAATTKMSPDQRKLWFSVLKVLEQASLAHQQVLMGSEVLFTQLDGTASQLRDYLGLMQTIDGVDALLGSVDSGGMAGFVDGMRTLQDQMEVFSQTMDSALESSMIDLETRVDSLQSVENEGDTVMAPSSVDEELQTRMDRVAPTSAGKK